MGVVGIAAVVTAVVGTAAFGIAVAFRYKKGEMGRRCG